MLAQFSVVPLPYHPSEPEGWSTSLHQIKAALAQAEEDGIVPRALVVINPGNPTSAILDKDTMAELVKLCEEHSLVLLADEVYQVNLHWPDTHPFTSFKQAVRQLSSVLLFHSIFKGVKGVPAPLGVLTVTCQSLSRLLKHFLYSLLNCIK